MPLVYSYSRVSSLHQAKDDKHGLKRQKEAIQSWLSSHPNCTLADNLIDAGVSAFKGHNLTSGSALAGFLQMVTDGTVAKGSILLLDDLSRFTRTPAHESLPLVFSILSNDITICSISDNLMMSKDDLLKIGDLTQLLFNLYRNHSEVAQRTSKVSAAWKEKQKKAADNNTPMSSICPSWLKLKSDRTGYDVIPEKAEVVRRVFAMRLEGMPHNRIATVLNSEGIPRLSSRKTKTGLTTWVPNVIRRLLHSKTVIGTLERSQNDPHDVDKVGYYPSVISVEDFNRVQLLSHQGAEMGKRSYPHAVNLFRGLCECSECHATMRAFSVTAKYTGSLQCPTRSVKGCSKPVFPMKKFEDAMVNRFFKVLEDNSNDSNKSLVEQVQQLQLQDDQLTKRISNTTSAVIDAETESERKLYQSKVRELQGQQLSLRNQMQQLQQVLSATRSTSLSELDLNTVEGRKKSQLVVMKVVQRMIVDTEAKTVDILLRNGNIIKGFDLTGTHDNSMTLINSLEDASVFGFTGTTRTITKPEGIEDTDADDRPPADLA